MSKSDPGRGQLRKRSARAWRDEANPTGPGVVSDEAESDDAAADAEETPENLKADEPVDAEEPANAGAGGGGATESAPGDRQHGAQHGGPSHKS